MVFVLTPDYQPILTLEEGEREFSRLRKSLEENGVFKRSYFFYFCFFIGFFSVYVSTFYLLSVVSSYFAVVLVSIFLGFVVVQSAGIMHDAAHHAIFKTNYANILCSHIFGAIVGANPRYWFVYHNLHHAHPNQLEKDPDLKIPFSFTSECYLAQKGVFRWLRPIQNWTWFPLCMFTLFQMQYRQHIVNIIQKYKQKLYREIPFDVLWTCFAFFVWVGLPFVLFDPVKAVLVVCTTYLVAGFYAANIFAPNHKAMPQLGKDVSISNLEQQMITTRNVVPSVFNDFIFMCLNYQVEHHLFPDCPRNKYKLIVPYVRELAQRTGLPYLEETPLNSFKAILKELSAVANESKKIEKKVGEPI